MIGSEGPISMSRKGHDDRVKDIVGHESALAEAGKAQRQDISSDEAISLDVYKR
jgi:hypothetical protein